MSQPIKIVVDGVVVFVVVIVLVVVVLFGQVVVVDVAVFHFVCSFFLHPIFFVNRDLFSCVSSSITLNFTNRLTDLQTDTPVWSLEILELKD